MLIHVSKYMLKLREGTKFMATWTEKVFGVQKNDPVNVVTEKS